MIDTVMNYWGRELPKTPVEACRNFKTNIGDCWKVTRLVTSTVLGVAGLALASHCYSIDNTPAGLVVPTATAAPSATAVPVGQIDVNACSIGCLSGGMVYGVAGAVVMATVIVKKVMRPVKNFGWYGSNKELTEVTVDALPRFMAGGLGSLYGIISMPICVLIDSKHKVDLIGCKAVNGIGMVSASLYFVDVGLCVFDMVCLEKSKRSQYKELTDVVMGDPLPEVEGDPQVVVDSEEGSKSKGCLCCCKGEKQPHGGETAEAVEMVPMIEAPAPEGGDGLGANE